MKLLGKGMLPGLNFSMSFTGLEVELTEGSPRRSRTNLSQNAGFNWEFCEIVGRYMFSAPKSTSELVTVLRLMRPGSR